MLGEDRADHWPRDCRPDRKLPNARKKNVLSERGKKEPHRTRKGRPPKWALGDRVNRRLNAGGLLSGKGENPRGPLDRRKPEENRPKRTAIKGRGTHSRLKKEKLLRLGREKSQVPKRLGKRSPKECGQKKRNLQEGNGVEAWGDRVTQGSAQMEGRVLSRPKDNLR